MYFDKKIPSWDEGIQLGNGSTGCLIWDDNPLKFSIDRTDLWDTTPAPQTLSNDFNYKNFINLLRENRFEEMEEVFDKCYNYITPTKLLGGRIELSFESNPESIRYELDRKAPVARITVALKSGSVQVDSFVSAVEDMGMIRVLGTDKINISIIRPNYGTESKNIESLKSEQIIYGKACDLLYPPPEIIEDSEHKGFIQETNEDFKYMLFLQKRKIERGFLIAYTIKSGSKSCDFSDYKKKLEQFLDSGFEAERKKHLEWWEKYYSASDIKISDYALQELWDIGNYLLGCVSRKGAPPMPLQGVFTADCGELPPWKGDYHNDTNTQMSYYSYLKSNHIEQGESFIDFLVSLMPQFKEFAKSFFDADDALNVPGVMTIKGKPMGGWPIYALSITNAVWLCRSLEEYYNYTLDEAYLKEILYPFMSGVERSIYRWLVPNEAGGRQLAFSSSPEWKDHCSESCFFEYNTNYDIMLVRYLYEKLGEYAHKFNDFEKYKYYKEIEASLPTYYTGAEGFLLTKDFPLNESHRHFSHLMAIHPLRTVRFENNKDLILKSISHLEHLGHSYWVGFSFAWMSELYAIAKNGEGAAYMLKLFYDNLCLPNGFHCNGDYKHRGITVYRYRPVTLESNMAAMDAVQEMLLYGEKGIIEVFPAVPYHVSNTGASFSNLRTEGAALVSSEISDGRVTYIKITALKGGRFTIRLPREMKLKAADLPIFLDNTCCVYNFKENETIMLS